MVGSSGRLWWMCAAVCGSFEGRNGGGAVGWGGKWWGYFLTGGVSRGWFLWVGVVDLVAGQPFRWVA